MLIPRRGAEKRDAERVREWRGSGVTPFLSPHRQQKRKQKDQRRERERERETERAVEEEG